MEALLNTEVPEIIQVNTTALVELTDLQLVLAGGGSADVILA